MLPLPKLDDRSYEEIRDEAVQNIVRHCPDWTNHNASDPGITLIELFSSMTEMLQYRLNRVPQKNYLAFLDMLGIMGRLPTPARTRVEFKLSEGYELGEERKSTIKIDKDTTISTDDDEPILFETAKETQLSNLKLINLFSRLYDKDKNEHILIEHFDNFQKKEGFVPFERTKKSTNNTVIYIYDDNLSSLKDKSLVSLFFRIPTGIKNFRYESEESFLKQLDWEYYDGERWQRLSIADSEFELKEFDTSDAKILPVTFEGNCQSFQKASIPDVVEGKHYFIRAILRESKRWLSDFEIYEISVASKSRIEGIIPDGCNYRYEQLDLNNEFYPFGTRPKNDDIIKHEEYFYIKSKEAFSKKGAKISLTIKHSHNTEYNMPKGENNLQLGWQYFNDKDAWTKLSVQDGTNNFTANGVVTFRLPKDIAMVDINGERDYWIKCTIDSGDYGEEEKRELVETKREHNGNEIIEMEERIISGDTLNPPKLSRIVISYHMEREDLEACTIYNNYTYTSKKFDVENYSQKLFDQKESKEQSLNFCFDSYLSEEYIDLYFDIEESVVEKRNLKINERRLVWELLLGEEWVELKVEDETDELTRSGDIRLYFPRQNSLSSVHINGRESKGMWIKARVKSNALNEIPMINGIQTNTVIALQKESFSDEFLGKSIGLPEMSFELNHNNIIEPPRIFVEEEEFFYTKRFIEHNQDDRVFRFYGITGEVKFGDGKYGKIPKPNVDIHVASYATTLGKKGNVDSHKIINLRKSISFVESVTNIVPAIGGADGDDLDMLKKYAPSEFKTRDRAITAEDYESLTTEFSSNIINAKATSQNGDVNIVVVTRDIIEEDGFINRKLIQDLEEYLQSKSLVTVKPSIKSPIIIPLSIEVEIKTTTSQNELSIDELEEKLNSEAKRYFSLTTGGDKGEGYLMGKNISRSDLYRLLNRVDNTLYFDNIMMNNGGDKVLLEYNHIVKFEKLIVKGDLGYDD